MNDRGAQWDLMRLVRDRGGEIRQCMTSYDHEAGGRVVQIVAFYPGNSGYPDVSVSEESNE